MGTSCALNVVLSRNVAKGRRKIKRVGIYAGAFDPVHDGHLAFARAAAAEAKLDKVFFVVEPRPRHKQGVKAASHRIAMVQLAIKDDPLFGVLILDDARPSILETWPHLQARFADAEVVVLMGDDVFKRLSHWPRVDGLVTGVRFAVGVREGKLKDLKDHLTVIAETRALGFQYNVFVAPLEHVSSVTLRRQLRSGTRPTGLANAVWRYIQTEGLYSASLTDSK